MPSRLTSLAKVQAAVAQADTAVFPRGWAGTWQIHETIRKLYVLF